jgi:hypothetical protein
MAMTSSIIDWTHKGQIKNRAMKRNPVLNLLIEPELADAIQQFCERFGMTKSVAIRELIRRGMEAAKEK